MAVSQLTFSFAQSKRCASCKKFFPTTTDFFSPKKMRSGSLGLASRCKKCRAKATREYKAANRDKVRISKQLSYIKHRAADNARSRKWRANNIDRHKLNFTKWCEANKERKKFTDAKWKAANPDKSRAAWRKYAKKRANDPTWRLSNRISRAMKRGIDGKSRGKHWETLVGYTVAELMAHLESKFLPGMTWQNKGRGRNCWHIDHIRPVSSFSFTSHEDPAFRECWALSNLQPLWEPDNMRKGRKVAVNE